MNNLSDFFTSTTGSGSFTVLVEGTFSGGTTVDWSGTGHIVSDFDAIIITGETIGATTIGGSLSVIIPSHLAIGNDIMVGNMIGAGATRYSRLRLDGITETSGTVTDSHAQYSGVVTGIFGVNYS